MDDRGTTYAATVVTPSGIRFRATVVVPPDAEYADQHELSEVAQAGVARMVGAAARIPRADTVEPEDPWAATIPPDPFLQPRDPNDEPPC